VNTQYAGLTEKYKILSAISANKSAGVEIRQVERKADQKMFVCKKFEYRPNRSASVVQRQKDELKILQMMNHIHIVKLEEVCYHRSSLCIIMEQLAGDFFDYLSKILEDPNCWGINEELAAKWFAQILDALDYLHDQHIIHRDLKPENILLTDLTPIGDTKLCDFGVSKWTRDGRSSSYIGTRGYMAPEISEREGSSYGFKVDCWSLGITLYQMLSGMDVASITRALPDCDNDDDSEAGRVFFPGDRWNSLSSLVKELISSLLRPDPLERISVKEAKKHEWFKSADSPAVRTRARKRSKAAC